MPAAHGWVLAILAVALLCGSPVWADSTLHIGTRTGTACQAGCAGDPNLIDGGGSFDIAQMGTQQNGKVDGTPVTEAGLITGPGGLLTTPEPETLALLGLGLLTLGGIARRRLFNS